METNQCAVIKWRVQAGRNTEAVIYKRKMFHPFNNSVYLIKIQNINRSSCQILVLTLKGISHKKYNSP